MITFTIAFILGYIARPYIQDEVKSIVSKIKNK